MQPEEGNELALRKGDVIIVTDGKDSEDWWTGELQGDSGHFPKDYVHPVTLPPLARELLAMIVHAVRAAEVVVTFPAKYGSTRFNYNLVDLRDKRVIRRQPLAALAKHGFTVRRAPVPAATRCGPAPVLLTRCCARAVLSFPFAGWRQGRTALPQRRHCCCVGATRRLVARQSRVKDG